MKIFTWRQRFLVILVNVVSLCVFVGGGYLLDRTFGLFPALSIIGLITSFITGQIVLAKVLLREYHRNSR